jgi:EmrB/QacA subfamily drug resistance transporter
MIGVLSPPEQRGKYMAYIAGLSAVATVGGPLVGGILTDEVSWRWAFYINLPIGAIALLIILTRLHLPHSKISHKIDYLGSVLITVTTTAFVLLCVWAGTRYDWDSVQVIVLLAVAVVGLAGSIAVERRAAEPVFVPSLFTVRNFSVSLVLGFLVGIALYGSITFLPLYQQNVQHTSATGSGLLLLPVLVGMLVTSIFSGRAMSNESNHRPFAVLGGLALTAGSFLLMQLTNDTSRILSSSYMVVFGIGLGFLFQNVLVIAQNSVTPQVMGAASGSLVFFRTIGGVLGVSFFAAVFSNRLHDYLSTRLSATDLSKVTTNGGQLNSDTVQALSPGLRDSYVNGVAHAIQGVFAWALPAFIVAFLVGFLVQAKKPMATAPAPVKARKEEKKEAAGS